MTEKTIKGRDIIIVGQQPWDVEIGSNCKNIALEFSKQNRVLYVNSPLDRITSIKKKNDPEIVKRLGVIKGKESGLVQLNSNLWNLYPDCIVESINWISKPSVFNFINKINNKRFADSIKKSIKALGFSDYILFNDNEIMKCFYLKELLKPFCSVYYSRDYILATDYWKKHGFRLEPVVIKSSDACVANSTYLAEYCRQYNERSFYVGQGCDLEAYQQEVKMPDELKDIKQPIIGYTGAVVTSRLDIAILEHIANSFANCTLVLVGPEDETFAASRLHNLNNVLFVGARPPYELPGYVNAFSVCINPQIVNQLTIGNYPRKVDEYLAMGKPVVATRTKAMETFDDYVYLAENKDDYVELIKKALEENSSESSDNRKRFAATHTWQNSVEEIYKSTNISTE
jgi:glycosyltransferase involved in cell wall biosynthesis